MSKLMMLVAAKWRDFSELNPHTQPDADVSSTNIDDDSRNARANRSGAMQEAEDEEEDDEDSDKKKKSRSSRVKKGKKASKVPTLKIKLGKRKRGSSVCMRYVRINFCTILILHINIQLLFRTRKRKVVQQARRQILIWNSSRCWRMRRSLLALRVIKAISTRAVSNRRPNHRFAERRKPKSAIKPRKRRKQKLLPSSRMERKVSR